MPRYRNRSTGVIVSVRDDRPMDRGRWEALEGAVGAPSSPPATDWQAMTVEQLKGEIRRRNEGRDDEDRLPLTGSKSDIVAALEVDDE